MKALLWPSITSFSENANQRRSFRNIHHSSWQATGDSSWHYFYLPQSSRTLTALLLREKLRLFHTIIYKNWLIVNRFKFIRNLLTNKIHFEWFLIEIKILSTTYSLTTKCNRCHKVSSSGHGARLLRPSQFDGLSLGLRRRTLLFRGSEPELTTDGRLEWGSISQSRELETLRNYLWHDMTWHVYVIWHDMTWCDTSVTVCLEFP